MQTLSGKKNSYPDLHLPL